jgi:hypothetical protein
LYPFAVRKGLAAPEEIITSMFRVGEKGKQKPAETGGKLSLAYN